MAVAKAAARRNRESCIISTNVLKVWTRAQFSARSTKVHCVLLTNGHPGSGNLRRRFVKHTECRGLCPGTKASLVQKLVSSSSVLVQREMESGRAPGRKTNGPRKSILSMRAAGLLNKPAVPAAARRRITAATVASGVRGVSVSEGRVIRELPHRAPVFQAETAAARYGATSPRRRQQ